MNLIWKILLWHHSLIDDNASDTSFQALSVVASLWLWFSSVHLEQMCAGDSCGHERPPTLQSQCDYSQTGYSCHLGRCWLLYIQCISHLRVPPPPCGNQQCSSCQGVIADLAPPSNVQLQNTIQAIWAALVWVFNASALNCSRTFQAECPIGVSSTLILSGQRRTENKISVIVLTCEWSWEVW